MITYKVRISYIDFFFTTLEDAIKFADKALKHIDKKEDIKKIVVLVEYEKPDYADTDSIKITFPE